MSRELAQYVYDSEREQGRFGLEVRMHTRPDGTPGYTVRLPHQDGDWDVVEAVGLDPDYDPLSGRRGSVTRVTALLAIELLVAELQRAQAALIRHRPVQTIRAQGGIL